MTYIFKKQVNGEYEQEFRRLRQLARADFGGDPTPFRIDTENILCYISKQDEYADHFQLGGIIHGDADKAIFVQVYTPDNNNRPITKRLEDFLKQEKFELVAGPI